MAVKLTIIEARKVARWCKKQLGLPHWKFRHYWDKPPNWADVGQDDLGHSDPDLSICRAKIWVSLERHTTRQLAISTICHEYLHVFLMDRGVNDDNDLQHNIAYQQESTYAKAYMAGVK